MIQYVAVLPAYAGMFPRPSRISASNSGSPRVCGDVSDPPRRCRRGAQFSPRMRGCFSHPIYAKRNRRVLPAYAGMFLPVSRRSTDGESSPRVCGDVSAFLRCIESLLSFSPRMRGCFLQRLTNNAPVKVLPAYAGMFLSLETS